MRLSILKWFAIATLSATLLGTLSDAQSQIITTDLGTLDHPYSYAIAINEAGQVVGNNYSPDDGRSSAFSWTVSTGMVDLGTLGGTVTVAMAVNEAGQVVGFSHTAGNAERHAFSWTADGGIVDLGTLGGSDAIAFAVNESGQVLGSSTLGNAERHAFVWTAAGGMVDLGTLGGSHSTPAALNDAGQVVGFSDTVDDAAQHAFSWTVAGGMVDLGTLGGSFSDATLVTNTGQVVGFSGTAADGQHAFSWTAAGGMIDLGTLGGANSHPADVNEAGQIVGNSDTAGGGNRAFVWTAADGMIDLGGTLGGTDSRAHMINEVGQIAGVSQIAGNAGEHAFSWTAEGGMIDLGALGNGRISRPVAINDAGQIVGLSTRVPGGLFAPRTGFLWTPASGMIELTLGGTSSGVSAINEAGQVAGSSFTIGNAAQHAVLWQSDLDGDDVPDADDNCPSEQNPDQDDADADGLGDACEPNTPAGTNIAVQPVDASTGTAPATVTFGTVTQAGETTLAMLSSGPLVPAGFTLGDPPIYYEISTTAAYAAPVTVCVDYTSMSYTDESLLGLFHFESGAWVNRTSSLDTVANVICGSVSSLSPFAILQLRVPATTTDCKKDGWLQLRRRDNTPFKNQGDCVSYVNRSKSHGGA